MAYSSKLRDLKYGDQKLAIKHIVKGDLPVVVRTTSVANEEVPADIREDMEILFQRISKETCACIKVLQFYDNKNVQQEQGCEYVLEHDTFVGNEYLMPLSFPGKVKFVRRPRSRGRYLTVKQVLVDSPAFVQTEKEAKAFLSNDMEQTVMIQAKTILELKRKYSTERGLFLECSDGDRLYTFHENDEINFTVFERETLYSLSELSDMLMLPKVVLFQEINADDAVLKDETLRSAMLTMIDGPIEVLGFACVENLIGWIRNKAHKTYETILVPKNIWSKINVQKLCVYSDKENEKYIKRKYGQCLISDFPRKSLYLLPLDQCEVTWLRSPDMFKRSSTGNKLYDLIKIKFEDSSGDEEEPEISLYAEIEELSPPIPCRRPIHPARKPTKVKRNNSFLYKVWNLLKSEKNEKGTVGEANVKDIETSPERPPKPKSRVNTEVQFHNDALTRPDVTPNRHCSETRPLPPPPADSIRNKYTKLKFRRPSTVYDTPMVCNCIPNLEKKSDADANMTDELNGVLKSNQSQEDFFLYTVEEVSLCLENCGLKDLAATCFEQRLDGSFFKGFDDWNVLDLSSSDVVILKKVINAGWRSSNGNI